MNCTQKKGKESQYNKLNNKLSVGYVTLNMKAIISKSLEEKSYRTWEEGFEGKNEGQKAEVG